MSFWFHGYLWLTYLTLLIIPSRVIIILFPLFILRTFLILLRILLLLHLAHIIALRHINLSIILRLLLIIIFSLSRLLRQLLLYIHIRIRKFRLVHHANLLFAVNKDTFLDATYFFDLGYLFFGEDGLLEELLFGEVHDYLELGEEGLFEVEVGAFEGEDLAFVGFDGEGTESFEFTHFGKSFELFWVSSIFNLNDILQQNIALYLRISRLLPTKSLRRLKQKQMLILRLPLRPILQKDRPLRQLPKRHRILLLQHHSFPLLLLKFSLSNCHLFFFLQSHLSLLLSLNNLIRLWFRISSILVNFI